MISITTPYHNTMYNNSTPFKLNFDELGENRYHLLKFPEVKQLYQAGILNLKTYVYLALVAIFPPQLFESKRVDMNLINLAEQLELKNHRSLYRVIADLAKAGIMNLHKVDLCFTWNGKSGDSQNCESSHRIVNPVTELRSDSQFCENRTPEVLENKASDAPINIINKENTFITPEPENQVREVIFQPVVEIQQVIPVKEQEVVEQERNGNQPSLNDSLQTSEVKQKAVGLRQQQYSGGFGSFRNRQIDKSERFVRSLLAEKTLTDDTDEIYSKFIDFVQKRLNSTEYYKNQPGGALLLDVKNHIRGKFYSPEGQSIIIDLVDAFWDSSTGQKADPQKDHRCDDEVRAILRSDTAWREEDFLRSDIFNVAIHELEMCRTAELQQEKKWFASFQQQVEEKGELKHKQRLRRTLK